MLALHLGFRKVVLIGQDLAFTGGVSHTKGIGDALGDNDEYIKSRQIVEVEELMGQCFRPIIRCGFISSGLKKQFECIKMSLR